MSALAPNPGGDVISVGILDDHPTFRVGLRMVIERADGLEVAWDCGSISQALSWMGRLPVDVVIVDVMLDEEGDGIMAAEVFRERWPRSSVLFITGLDIERASVEAKRLGAAGAIGKEARVSEIVSRVREAGALAGRRPQARPAGARRSQPVTRREAEVLGMVGDGLRTRDIARALSISPATVNNHVQSAVRKLNAHSRAHAVTLLGNRRAAGEGGAES